MNEVMANNEEIDAMQSYTVNDFCRLCANLDDNMVPIYADEGADHMLENKIKTHLPFINICKNDLLPKRICYHCASAVLVWNELYECSTDADLKLRSMFEVNDFDPNVCKSVAYDDIEGIHEPVKSFIGDSIEYEEINDVNLFSKDDKSDKTLNELDKVPSTSKTDNLLNLEHKSSEIQDDANSLDQSLKSDIDSMFNRVEDDDDMYLNAVGIGDDMNGLMDCHRLDMSPADDCGGMIMPKQERLSEDDETAAHNKNKEHHQQQQQQEKQEQQELHDETIFEHQDDDEDPDQEGQKERADEDIEDRDQDHDDCSSLSSAAVMPGITQITGGPDSCNGDDDPDDPSAKDTMDDDGGGAVLGEGMLRQLYVNASPDDDENGEQQETMCQICATVFKTRYNLLRHFQKRHPEYKMYECDLCRISFPSIEEFKDHLDEKHSKVLPGTAANQAADPKQVRFACDVCGNMYKNKASAMNHLLTHTAKKDVLCNQCDFSCYTKQQLGVHQSKHDKRFVCDICHKRFAQKSQLDVHVNAVHYNQRPFVCVLCKKSFKTKGSHDAHMIVHTDTRNYQCPHCDKKCRKRYDLTLHIRTHTGEKPFKCSVCGRGFVQMCDTRKHEMLHFKPGKRKNYFISSPDGGSGSVEDE